MSDIMVPIEIRTRWRIHIGGALVLQTYHEDSFLWACQRLTDGKKWHVSRTTITNMDLETGIQEELIDYYLVERLSDGGDL